MEQNDIDIRGLLGVLRRQLHVILYTVVLILGLTTLWLFSLTPLYTASTLILIDPSSANLLDTAERQTSASSDNARVSSEVEIMRSEAIALAVVQNADLVSSPEFGVQLSLRDRVEAILGFEETTDVSPEVLLKGVVNKFSDAISVSRRGLTYLVELRVTSESPQTAADLANITAQTYIDQQIQAKIGSALAARDIIQARITQADSELVASERAFDDFIDLNFSRIEQETGRSDLTALREALEEIRDTSTQSRVIANEVSRNIQLGNWAEIAASLQDDTLMALQSQRDALTAEIANAASDEAINLRAELDALEARLADEAGVALSDLRAELADMESEASNFQSELRSSVLGADLPPELLTQIFSIQQRGTLARNQYQTLLSRLRDFETQADLQIADARVVSPAFAPSNPSFPDKKLTLALALMASLGLGVGLGFLREFYVGGFVSDTQAADVLNLPVSATVPRIEETGETPVDQVVKAPLSFYAEALRRLRASIDQTLLRNGGGTDDVTVVMVASTVPAEGKTTTSLSLARTYAISGKRTLLIDCDLRKPSISKTLSLTGKTGLLDYLIAPADEPVALADIMALDPLTDLEIIPSMGRSNRPTDQLLTSKAFTELMKAVRDHYEVIILDTPPMLPVVDGRYLAHHADAIALVIKWAETRQQDVRQTMNLLNETKNEGAPIFGVLNQQNARNRKYYYQGYYTYGGGYAQE
ncbi:capsular exopolysaccharide family [Monaibacterium marinum]|uniref:non-specific protein-tyrosine kinase n=1 Tax=Pontivivens marinum TaxID=1690039 RepID=A0A2C9CW52_9RHOB|nr:polysaccharide biosynthesis tyrosine autokinase [Monaibacterium marinum]SOH95443.1 capsular exopolysaccharide family [Monaibacterium marinum]